MAQFPPQDIEEKIEYYADLYGADVNLMKNIAWCESNFIEDAQNPHSTAGGVMQYLDSTFENYCSGDKFDADDNIRCAAKMISNGGISHWNASRGCWSELAINWDE